MAHELEARRTVEAPQSAVWAIVSDMDRWVDVVSAIQTVERLDEGAGFGVGTTWRVTRTVFGKEATEVMEVTELVDGERYVTTAESHGSRYTSTISVTALGDDRCELAMHFSAEPLGALAKVMAATLGRLFAGATRKAIAGDLDDIAAAATAS